jgi:rubrerythrin
VHAFFARVAAPFVFRIPGHAARKFQGFARAEHGSMLDLKLAAAQTTSPKRSALYLRHALDEARHTQMFAARSTELRRERGDDSLGHPQADTEHLFESLGETRFLAFVHLGEKRGCDQFEAYRDHFGARGDKKTRAMFEAILGDEREHHRYTRELLVELAGGEKEARREIRKAVAWEAWRTWRRAGRFLAQVVYTIAMTTLYVAIAPFALLIRVAKPQRLGWASKSLRTR